MSRQPWTRYYDAAGDEPRDTLVRALELFGTERGQAVDLGCGTGRDTAELLRRGWSVVAVDGQEEAIKRLRAKLGDERLTTEVALFEDFRFPETKLVNSSYALPFCPPDAFPVVWNRIWDALVPGGRFAGHLFGNRDDWARTGGSLWKGEITFQTRAELDELLTAYDVEVLDEIEEEGRTATGEDKHWHVFNLVVRKP